VDGKGQLNGSLFLTARPEVVGSRVLMFSLEFKMGGTSSDCEGSCPTYWVRCWCGEAGAFASLERMGGAQYGQIELAH